MFQELPNLVAESHNVDMNKAGVFGHSMGGHGALVAFLRNPQIFKVLGVDLID